MNNCPNEVSSFKVGASHQAATSDTDCIHPGLTPPVRSGPFLLQLVFRVAPALQSLFHYRFVLYGLFLVYFVRTVRTRNYRNLIASFKLDTSPVLRYLVYSVLGGFVVVLVAAYIQLRLAT